MCFYKPSTRGKKICNSVLISVHQKVPADEKDPHDSEYKEGQGSVKIQGTGRNYHCQISCYGNKHNPIRYVYCLRYLLVVSSPNKLTLKCLCHNYPGFVWKTTLQMACICQCSYLCNLHFYSDSILRRGKRRQQAFVLGGRYPHPRKLSCKTESTA